MKLLRNGLLVSLLVCSVATSACSDDPPKGDGDGGWGFDLGQDDTGSDAGGGDVADDAAAPDTTTVDLGRPDVPPDMVPDTSRPDMNRPAVEDCVNGVDDDANGQVDCADRACFSAPPCLVEDCTNNVDDDGDGLVDCADFDCGLEAACLVEICTNGKSDDDDTLVDCADDDCATHPRCTMTPEDCGNGLDDDGDGTTDCRDDDCAMAQPCLNPSNAGTCTADGQQCDPADGSEQNGFYCANIPGTPGLGICYEICDPAAFPTSCAWGTVCADAAPNDADPRGVCFPTQCTQPFAQAECAQGQQCEPFINGYSYCRDLGTAGDGDPCGENAQCGSGYVCIAGECTPSCDTSSPACDADETCVPVYAGFGYGICDVECAPLSSGQCESGDACVPATGVHWACRPDPGGQVGDACQSNSWCGDGLWCIGGSCVALCADWATSRCTGNQTCVDFGNGFGMCAQECTDLAPDDCPNPDSYRCSPASETSFVCLPHANVGVGETCDDTATCGANLYCSEAGVCEQLCDPYDASGLCPAGEACIPYYSAVGVCVELTSEGRAQDEQCPQEGQACGDALYCGQGFPSNVCYGICRAALSDADGKNNPDCADPDDTCNTMYGWADLGICL